MSNHTFEIHRVQGRMVKRHEKLRTYFCFCNDEVTLQVPVLCCEPVFQNLLAWYPSQPWRQSNLLNIYFPRWKNNRKGRHTNDRVHAWILSEDLSKCLTLICHSSLHLENIISTTFTHFLFIQSNVYLDSKNSFLFIMVWFEDIPDVLLNYRI